MDGLPDTLVARRLETLTRRVDGTVAPRSSARSGAVLIDEVWGIALVPSVTTMTVPHTAVRKHLAAGKRKVRPDMLSDAYALAAAGLVALRIPVKVANGRLAAQRPTAWHRTPAGADAAERYQPVDRSNLIDNLALAAADCTPPGPVQDWAAAYAQHRNRLGRLVDAAREAARSGTFIGQPPTVAARELTGDTHGLDHNRPEAAVVWDAVAYETGCAATRDAALVALGTTHMRYASNVTAANLPGNPTTAAGRLLNTHLAEEVAAVMHLAMLPAKPVPPVVAAPDEDSPGWVFAVENEAMLAWAADHTDSPVVWHGTTAARHLLIHAAAAGWRIAISGDFEWGGLRRVASLLNELDRAVPWRLSADDYLDAADRGGSGKPPGTASVEVPWDDRLADCILERQVRVTEEDRFLALANDLRRGAPQIAADDV